MVCAESRKGQLTDQVADHLFGTDCPMRMALSPNGKSIVFAMSEGIKRLDQDTKGRVPKFFEIQGDLADKLSSIKGEVKALAFHPSGSHLAVGCASGELRVYEWPSLKVKFQLSGDKKLSDAVRDLDFSPQLPATASGPALPAGRVLGLTVDDGTCELWDWERGVVLVRLAPGKLRQRMERAISMSSDRRTTVQQLPRGIERVQLSKLRFARDGTGDLLTLLNSPVCGASVARWGGAAALGLGAADAPELPVLASCRKVCDPPATCFDASRDGTLLAFGTSEGGVVVTTSVGCVPVRKVLKGHMVFTTGIVFSADSRSVVSTSADASALVTTVGPAALKQAVRLENGRKLSVGRVLLVVLLLLAVVAKVLLQAWREAKRRGVAVDVAEYVLALFGRSLGKDEL
ncbi:hypothetical protein FOA52_006949 [Chlamydomonas sp. UWO 241]|nr:hypothetical protein FOA52_006949 [Chlamydomonas sp. UWO 241]